MIIFAVLLFLAALNWQMLNQQMPIAVKRHTRCLVESERQLGLEWEQGVLVGFMVGEGEVVGFGVGVDVGFDVDVGVVVG